MLALYGVYILIMMHNEFLKGYVTRALQSHPVTASLISSAASMDGPDDVFGSTSSSNLPSSTGQRSFFDSSNKHRNYQTTTLTTHSQNKTIEDDSMFMAALLVIVQHKRLFSGRLRFQSAARYIIIKRQHRFQQRQKCQQRSDEVNYVGPESEPLKSGQKERIEAYALSAPMSKNKFSIVSKDDYEFWNRPPEPNESECPCQS